MGMASLILLKTNLFENPSLCNLETACFEGKAKIIEVNGGFTAHVGPNFDPSSACG